MNGTILFLLIVLIILSILVILVIMAQNPKGGGLSSSFGGSGTHMFGVQRTNTFMDKATWALGIAIIVLILITGSIMSDGSSSSSDTTNDGSTPPATEKVDTSNDKLPE